MPQHTLWSEDHERLAPRAQSLATQKMEVLRRCGRLADLEIVDGRELQETFNAGAGVLRSLAFVAVGQQHHQAGQQIPFRFPRHNELIDDGLRTVGKVAELRLPKDQRLRKVATVAVFKAENSSLGQGRVVNPAVSLAFGNVLERYIFLLSFDVEQNGVALIEGAAAAVLATQAHRMPSLD